MDENTRKLRVVIGEHYGAHTDASYAGPIIPRSCYEIRGSSGGVHGDDDEDDMSDPYVRSENCVASDDDNDDMQD
nr:hypothetical protein [Tanacetum cinerariifolium]